MLSVFSWKAALEMPQKYKFSYFQKQALERKATRIAVENLSNSIKSGKYRNIATLIKI